MFGIVRRATKVVVYTAVPLAGPAKALTVGTRGQRLRAKSAKEQRKQTALLEQQTAAMQQALAMQAQVGAYQPVAAPYGLRSEDGAWWWDGRSWQPVTPALDGRTNVR